MGCGESKHDVATGNTITRKKSKDLEIIQEADKKENSPELQENAGADHGDVKDIVEQKEVKEDGGVETGRIGSKDSPHRFFSPRKDDDGDGEGRSDKSETFYSPRVESGKETLFNVGNGKMKDDKLAQEAKQETDDQTAISKEDLVEEAKPSSSADKPADVASPASEKTQISEEAVAVPVTKDDKAI